MEYAKLAELYGELEATKKRLEKTFAIAEFLKNTPKDEIEHVMLLLQARAFPSWQKQTLGIASKTMLKTLSSVTGLSQDKLENEWKKSGDLGIVAEKHTTKQRQAVLVVESLTTQKVFQTLRKLAAAEGTKSSLLKTKLLSELFSQASPLETRYLVRTVLEDLRVGVAEGTLRDAIVWAFFPNVAPAKPDEDPQSREEYKRVVQIVQDAYDRTNDFATLATTASLGEAALTSVQLKPGNPVKVMLASREPTMEIALERTGLPSQAEYKYDGFRVELHKNGDEITIFTRRLENVTEAFPDIVELARQLNTAKMILDAEAIGIDPVSGKYVPFQNISQRIRRKYKIEEVAEKLPVSVACFDALMIDGEDLLQKPLSERQAKLKKLVGERHHGKSILRFVDGKIVNSAQDAREFFTEAKAAGCEGIMLKKLDSFYRPGARVGEWIKQKEVMEALDLVVVAGQWGEGKRSGWLTSFELACRSEEGEFLTIGNVGTGLKELPEEGLSFGELTELLKPHIEYEKGKSVTIRPAIVLEIAYEEIQKSPSATSGYALRFPRVLRNRTDERGPDDASTLSYVEQLFSQQ